MSASVRHRWRCHARAARIIEAALINARLKLDLMDGAEVRFGDEADSEGPTALNNTSELRQLNDALRILGFDIGHVFEIPARPDLPQR